ncbi:hypothetical protein [Priestia megaterium]|uniref:hypothetical protein n=1 Tax=Priestia megaterium TaxID=1404 RepID=UPI002E1D91B1|nr:hypothetical protein [Priestia megaterium]
MAVPFSRINKLLTKWAANDPLIEDFTVENVIYALNIDNVNYRGVLKHLMSKRDTELIAQKVLLCPECSQKSEWFDYDEEIDEDEIFTCTHGHEFTFDSDNLIVVFQFTEGFKMDAVNEEEEEKTLKKKTFPQNRLIMLV